jgi:glycolate oxidase FAD binding subunit
MKPTPERLEQLFGPENIGTLPEDVALPAGVARLTVVAPPDIDALRNVLEVAAREAWRVLPAGSGEHLGRARIAAPDLVLSAQRMRAVVEYEPAEMVVEIEAGTTLHELDALLAPHGQRLASDPWPGRAATLGGAVAGNRFGLNRRRGGTLRDALLGARVLHADGSVSKTGGQVVKNVAGYDLGKLYVGSCGSLAFIHRMHLRLVSRPETSALVVAAVERSGAAPALAAVHRAAVEPVALLFVAGTMVEALGMPVGQMAIVARFEGREAVVRQQMEIATGILAGEVYPAARATIAYEALRAGCEPRPDAVLLRMSTLPVAGTKVLELLAPIASWERGAGCVVQYGVGTAHVQLPSLAARELRALRQACLEHGVRVAVEHAPPAFDTGSEAIDDPIGLDLATRIRTAYDPAGRWAAAPRGIPVA